MLRRPFSLLTGLEICLGKPLDDTLLHLVHSEVQRLYHSLDVYREKEDKDVERVCSTLALLKSEFHRSIVSLEEEQSSLQKTCEDLKLRQDVIKEEMTVKVKEQKELLRTSKLHWQRRQEQVESLCKTMEVKRANMQRDLDVLKRKVASLSCSEDTKEVVFDAPEESKWFTGREKEVDILERCFLLGSGSGVEMAAICGLGGCGKTTLAARFAWKHKPEYDGGVFWISMEDDRKFENSMNDLALRLGMLADSFDLTLSKVLECLSQRKKPWLLVLDDVDQSSLSDQMRRVLTGRWKRQANGQLLLTTRREPKEVCDSLDITPSCCVEIFSFSEDEAKTFLVNRSGIDNATGEEEALNALVHELGCLPLALEQAGAHMKALQCPVSRYLEGYKSQRLKLLNQHPAKPAWEYESQSRLAVHTTWLMNFEYVKNSPHGELASSFVQASAFLAPHEIQQELINLELLSVVNTSGQSINPPVVTTQIMEILTKFSLFQRKGANSLSLHRLVQEVVRNRMTTEENAFSLLRAIRLLHRSFHDCPSPDEVLTDVVDSVQERASASVADPSRFYLWSKLTSHASELQNHLKSLLDKQDIERGVKILVLTNEASRVVYENAVKLGALGHQEEAKEAERFAFQILDSGTSQCVALSLDQLRKLFPHTLPLSQVLQKIILYSSQPPVDKQKPSTIEDQQIGGIDDLRLQGNAFFKKQCFKEAIDSYTKAIELSKGTKTLDPRLLNNRATTHLKLGNFDKCLQDSEEYIKIMPNCWKGYTRKALALNGLGRKQPALSTAAIAFYTDASCCRRYKTFKDEFKDLDGNWEVVDSETLKEVHSSTRRKVLLVHNGEYEIDYATVSDLNIVAVESVPAVTVISVSLELHNSCFFQSINFEMKQSILVKSDANVEFDGCKFHCSSVDEPSVSVQGTATFVECEVSNSRGGGIIVQGYSSSASLTKCHIWANGNKPLHSSGISALNGGNLMVRECHVYGNTEGIHIGNPFGYLPEVATVSDSEIYDNKYEGLIVAGNSNTFSTVEIKRNKIYHNGGYGFRVSYLNDGRSLLDFQENMVFENFWWGIWVQCNSGGHYKLNKIFNNKMGGIRVGKRSPGMPAGVVENNVVHDNCGPAIREGLRHFEHYSFPKELQKEFMKQLKERIMPLLAEVSNSFLDREVSLPNTVSAKCMSNQCFQNENGMTKLQTEALPTNCAFCFRSGRQLKSCKRCMTTRYCGKECQKMHWRRHKYLCHAKGQISAVEVSIPVCSSGKATVTYSSTNPGLEPTGPNYASPPPRNGNRFIVKLQTSEGLLNGESLDYRGFVSDEYVPNKASVTIYDRSRHVDFTISGQPLLYHSIMECGIMGASMYLSKKLFCWAAFKDGKTIRIFTHEFPPVQKW